MIEESSDPQIAFGPSFPVEDGRFGFPEGFDLQKTCQRRNSSVHWHRTESHGDCSALADHC